MKHIKYSAVGKNGLLVSQWEHENFGGFNGIFLFYIKVCFHMKEALYSNVQIYKKIKYLRLLKQKPSLARLSHK